MALLVHWHGQVDQIAVHSDGALYELIERWFGEITSLRGTAPDSGSAGKRWDTAQKFLDYLEVNAEAYWQVPTFQLGAKGGEQRDELLDDGDDEDRFESA